MTTLYQRSWPQMNETPDSLLATDEPPPFTVDNENGTSPLLIVADHAGKHFPRRLGQLGLSNAECERHSAEEIFEFRDLLRAFQREHGITDDGGASPTEETAGDTGSSRVSVSHALERIRQTGTKKTLCRHTPKVGVVCPNWARTDLCGGRPVT